MKAIVRTKYGPPEVLKIREIEKPEVPDDGVLVRVRATSVNMAEWYAMTGLFLARIVSGLARPKDARLGADFAGVVEAAGKEVTDFKPGDEVFGGRDGAYADYVTVRKAIAPKPADITFEEAAAVPTAGITALQGLRDFGKIQPGQKVLINGASGGVGSFAVQIAKALGAEVTAVCSTRNVERARSLGADHVFDCTKEDFRRRMTDILCLSSFRLCSRQVFPFHPSSFILPPCLPSSLSLMTNPRLPALPEIIWRKTAFAS